MSDDSGEKKETGPAMIECSDDEESEEKMPPEEVDARLLQATKDGNIDLVKEYLSMGGNVSTTDTSGWNPILWASCNGNEEIVKLLITNGALNPYLQDQIDKNSSNQGKDQDPDEEKDPFKPKPDHSKTGKYTPLHWASYKGHLKVVWILLQKGLSPTMYDMHGNTAVHQAAASGNDAVLKCFLSYGVDVEKANAREHTPLMLATKKETRALIVKAMSTKQCKGSKCGHSTFDFQNIRYYCEMSTDFFCAKCSTRDWVYESKSAVTKDRPVCLSDECAKIVKKHEQNLRDAIESHEFQTVDKAITGFKEANVDVDAKLRNVAEILHLKLEKELDIRNYIESLAHVDNYKVILKSSKLLMKKMEDALALNVQLDEQLVDNINRCHARLIAERNLRNEMLEISEEISSASKESIGKLQGLIDDAQSKTVEDEYMQSAKTLMNKMEGNLEARTVLMQLQDYPIREFPEEEIVDPKAKGKKDEKKKKKKKKEPALNYPEWGVELEDVVKKYNNIKALVKNAQELILDDKFVEQVRETLVYFDREIKYRKDMEAEALAEAEARALAKKKKAKK